MLAVILEISAGEECVFRGVCWQDIQMWLHELAFNGIIRGA